MMPLSRRQFLSCATATAFSTALMPMTALSRPNSELQRQLNRLVKQQRIEGRISASEQTAWSVYDFHAGKKLVSINEYQALQGASMIKIFVALAYFYLHKQASAKYPYDWSQQQMMEKMLVKSSNTATNTILKWCGGPVNVVNLCQRATGNRFPHLSLVEYIPKGGKTYRNRASALDYSRFYYDLWHNRLPMSWELKRILSIKNHDRITTEQMAYDVTVYDKTGSTGMLCGDAGIVQLGYEGNAYTFIGILERKRRAKNYGSWITARSKAMREVSDLVYRYMTQRYLPQQGHWTS